MDWLLADWHWLIALYIASLYVLAGWAIRQDGEED